ncbi:MAG: GyrI-like domain-containing protein [Clostridia bacterium]|nr:GyrI-like domain-containing protein [Clostridia bacterium]
MSEIPIITRKTHLEEFYFLGIENLVTDNSDFGAFWSNFFDKGGYDKIDPYQKDPNCMNIWLTKSSGEKFYFQGKMVRETTDIPTGYTLAKFPAGDYLMVTTEWMPSYEDTVRHIDHAYHENAPIPAGYKRRMENDLGITLIERWGARTEAGYRYEFWVPLEKIK